MHNRKEKLILNTKSGKKSWGWLWLSALVVIIDQWTKYLVAHDMHYGQVIYIFPFLNIVYGINPGAAFNFLGSGGGRQIYLLSALAVVVVIILLAWLGKTSRREWLQAMALSLIIGGALGNLIDRIRLSYVIDFIDFHVKHWHYETFNIADSAITIGVLLLITSMLIQGRSGKRKLKF